MKIEQFIQFSNAYLNYFIKINCKNCLILNIGESDNMITFVGKKTFLIY